MQKNDMMYWEISAPYFMRLGGDCLLIQPGQFFLLISLEIEACATVFILNVHQITYIKK